MNATSLGNVVGGLFLRIVGDVARHGGGDHKRAGAALLEVVPDGFGAIESAGEIGGNDFFPVMNRAVKDAGVGGTAGIGNEAVDLFDMSILLLKNPHSLLTRRQGLTEESRVHIPCRIP